MPTTTDVFRRTRIITFDCYGTLVDWRAGLTQSFIELFGARIAGRAGEVFTEYARIEAEVQTAPYRCYRDVLGEVARRLASHLGIDLPADRASLLADRLPAWPVFGDTNAALARLKDRFHLGILSNIDRDLFAETAEGLAVPFDLVITAEDVGSYKPAHGHFERLLSTRYSPTEVLHVAQSLFHDGVPAHDLDLAYVWINRYNGMNMTAAEPLAEYPDLQSLADAIDDACSEKGR